MSPPWTFTQEIADAICEQLADGASLNSICKQDGYPSESTVRRWALDDTQGFAANYARAREVGYERLSEEIIQIADTPLVGVKTKTNDKGEIETTEGDMIEHRRLQVDARKWILAKMLPKRFGERIAQDVTFPGMGEMTDEQLNAAAGRIRTILATQDHRAGAGAPEVPEQAP